MPNRFQRQIATVEELRNVPVNTFLDVKDGSGLVVRTFDRGNHGVALLSGVMFRNGYDIPVDWYELDQAIEMFGPFYVVWTPPFFTKESE